ncbi:MAG: hypothetical protein IH787_07800 [Nitrospirae bacterium]|nr:hypothetical protein [Nitrospirota bacterium]
MQFPKRPGAWRLGLACAPFLLGLVAACASDPSPGRELSYGLTLAPTGIDPHINASVELGIPLSSVYDTLVFQDPETGAYVPGLATDWSISPDGLTYSFVLREQVVFHDGTRFDAEAVKANIDYVLDPDHRSQKAAAMLGPLHEVEVLGSYEVAFHLDRPYAPMLDSLGLSPDAAMLAAGSGSVIIKYVNSSYFWVCTSLSKLRVSDAIFGYGGATLVGGIVSFLVVCVMWVTGLI